MLWAMGVEAYNPQSLYTIEPEMFGRDRYRKCQTQKGKA